MSPWPKSKKTPTDSGTWLHYSFVLGLVMPKDEQDKKKDALGNPINDEEDAESKKTGEMILGIIVLIAVGFLLFKGVPSVFKSVTGYFGDKSDAKAACARHSSVINAQTDFAAKKAFKACLKRY